MPNPLNGISQQPSFGYWPNTAVGWQTRPWMANGQYGYAPVTRPNIYGSPSPMSPSYNQPPQVAAAGPSSLLKDTVQLAQQQESGSGKSAASVENALPQTDAKQPKKPSWIVPLELLGLVAASMLIGSIVTKIFSKAGEELRAEILPFSKKVLRGTKDVHPREVTGISGETLYIHNRRVIPSDQVHDIPPPGPAPAITPPAED